MVFSSPDSKRNFHEILLDKSDIIHIFPPATVTEHTISFQPVTVMETTSCSAHLSQLVIVTMQRLFPFPYTIPFVSISTAVSLTLIFFYQYFQSPFSFLMCFNNIHSSSLIRLYAHTPKTFLSPLSKYLCIHYQSQQCVLNDASFHLTVNSFMVRICCYIYCLCYFAHFPILHVSQY